MSEVCISVPCDAVIWQQEDQNNYTETLSLLLCNILKSISIHEHEAKQHKMKWKTSDLLSLDSMFSIDVASFLETVNTEDWVNKTLTSDAAYQRCFGVPSTWKQMQSSLILFQLEAVSHSIKIWFMQQSGFDENGTQTSKSIQTKSHCFSSQYSLLIFLWFVFPNPLIYPSSP